MTKPRRDYKAELNAALIASAANGWTYMGNNTMRRRTEHETPAYAINAEWYEQPTYSTLEFLSFLLLEGNRAPKAVYGTGPCPWVGRRDSKISFKRALELLGQPLEESAIHDRD